MVKNLYSEFINIYNISKTLRFELIPQGKTEDNIQKKGLIDNDLERDNEFLEIKKVMDKYFKYFIEVSLDKIEINKLDLMEYNRIYCELKKDKTNENLKEEYSKIQNKLRKYIYSEVKNKPNYNELFKKDFVQKILPAWLSGISEDLDNKIKDELIKVKKFSDWITYFQGFFENRKNIFTDAEIPTSMIYRIVNDNLPKFLDNLSKYEELKKYENKGFDFNYINNHFKSELNHLDINNFFTLSNFNVCLNQKGINNFNTIIGGKSLENGEKIKGLNELINLYSQQNNEEKSIKKLKLIPLFKQILSDRESFSFILEKFKDDKDVINTINTFYVELNNQNVLLNLKNEILSLGDKDLNLIYIKNDKNLPLISQRLFGDWEKIHQGLRLYAKYNLPNLKGDKKIESYINNTSYFSIYELEKAIELLNITNEITNENLKVYLEKINGNIKNPICGYLSLFKNKDENLFENINNNYLKFQKVLNKNFKENQKKLLTLDFESDSEIIKIFLDSILSVFHFMSSLNIRLNKKDEDKGQEAFEIDTEFYLKFNENYEKLKEIINIYNKTRNYITQKPFSTKKFKLNFENSTLLAGWDKNKEPDNFSVIFRKENNYYLGIMAKGNNKIFSKIENLNINSNYFEKMEYKLLPGPEKMLPKVFFSSKSIKFFNPSSEILAIRNYSTHTKGGNSQKDFDKKDFNLNDCHKMIDFFKESLNKHEEWRNYNFKFEETNTYKDISEFYTDISNQAYSINFIKIPQKTIYDLVEDGKLYLFQIYNKDFSSFSKGKKNLHTIYWEELFSKDNLNDIVYKLNGQAEIFFRKKSIDAKITHPKNQEILNKDPIKNKNKSNFSYDIIKDKKYSSDKYLFHCPITLNFKCKDKNKELNKKINAVISKNSNEINVLSIDRGERHLAYYTLLNSNGEILKQDSFNIITDEFSRNVNYHTKLDKLESSRSDARKNWKNIENIKELKEGYLSQVIHNIAKIAIEHNAIIIFEDLNFGFKRGRFKIEKQVYQKFEKMLIEKFNYLMFKDIDKNQVGGSLKAYQLTPKFESFKKMGKQTGIIYYVDANFTSKICPKTGFINLLYPKFENIEKTKDFISKFKYIKYNKSENLFEFNFNYSNFKLAKEESKVIQDNWSIYSNGKKLVSFKNSDKNNNWDIKEVEVNLELKKLFEEFNIDFKSGENLISKITKQTEQKFFKSLIYYLRLILQLRNSKINSDEDYILSCVKDKEGIFFDSRNASKNEPKNADANGAYNIGIKGLMLVEKIKKLKPNEKLDPRIIRDDFINFVIKKNK